MLSEKFQWHRSILARADPLIESMLLEDLSESIDGCGKPASWKVPSANVLIVIGMERLYNSGDESSISVTNVTGSAQHFLLNASFSVLPVQKCKRILNGELERAGGSDWTCRRWKKIDSFDRISDKIICQWYPCRKPMIMQCVTLNPRTEMYTPLSGEPSSEDI